MGLADRDYMRRPGAPFVGRGLSSWTVRLIVLCAAAYVVQGISRGWFGLHIEPLLGLYSRSPWRVWTLLTSAFLHFDLSHLLWNMVGLYFFGRMTEDTLGSSAFLGFCLVAAVCGSAAWLVDATVRDRDALALGASGFVSATLAYAALRHPRTPFRLLFFPFFPIPLWLLAVVWLGGDVLGFVRDAGGVGYAAHLGGALYGLITFRFGVLPRRLRWAAPRAGPPTGRSTGGGSAGSGGADQGRLQERVDRLLEKINREGIGSLSDEERRFLDDASRRYR